MMRKVAIALFISGVLTGGAAQAESTADALNAFGLLGTWSPDCAKDPVKEPGNRITYKVSAFGTATYTAVWSAPSIPPEEVEWEVKSAVRVTEDKIKMENEFKSGKELIPPQRKITLGQKSQTELVERVGKKLKIGENLWEKCLH